MLEAEGRSENPMSSSRPGAQSVSNTALRSVPGEEMRLLGCARAASAALSVWEEAHIPGCAPTACGVDLSNLEGLWP